MIVAEPRPEPPNLTVLYWPETEDDIARLAIRDDETGAKYGDRPEYRWFRPNNDADPWTWADLLTAIDEYGLSLDSAIQLKEAW